MGPRAARKLPHYGDMFWYFGMWARAEAPHAYAAQSYRRPVADTRRAGGSPFLASPALQLHLRALSRPALALLRHPSTLALDPRPLRRHIHRLSILS